MITHARRAIVALTLVAAPSLAHAQLINFDNVATSGYQLLGPSYAGVNWNNVYVMKAGTSFASVPAVSSPNVIFPGNGWQSSITSPTTFTLGSIDFIQWDPFNYGYSAPSTTVTGYAGGTQLFQQTIALGSSYATTVFNWAGVDQVTFDQLQGAGWYVADNVVLGNVNANTTAPEPATVGLFATGLVGLGAFVRRRRRA